MVTELIDADDQLAEFPHLGQPARIDQEITVPPVPGAPNGTPGSICFLIDLPSGTLRISTPRRWYRWRVTIGADAGEAGFWVSAPAPPMPVFGAPSAAESPPE
jgi:hypothetical protein